MKIVKDVLSNSFRLRRHAVTDVQAASTVLKPFAVVK